MARLAISASPFDCRWIVAGTEMRLERWTYAMCMRCGHRDRVVSEDECSRCARWEARTIATPQEADGRSEAPPASRSTLLDGNDERYSR